MLAINAQMTAYPDHISAKRISPVSNQLLNLLHFRRFPPNSNPYVAEGRCT